MIQSIQKIIKIGSSAGITLPSKDLKRQNISLGDEVEVIIRPIKDAQSTDQEVIDVAKKVLDDYKQDFKNLSKR